MIRRLITTIAAAILLTGCTFSFHSSPVKQISDLQKSTVEIFNISGSALGTGVIVGENEILTNNHVISGRDPIITLRGFKTEKNFTATIERQSMNADLALLSLSPSDWKEFVTENDAQVSQVESNLPSVGDKVTIVGNPMGFEFVVTQGTVTLPFTMVDPSAKKILHPLGLTDAVLDHGNSGGPVFDENGNVLGISELMAGNEHLYIPGNFVVKVLNDWKKSPNTNIFRLGIQVNPLMSSGNVIVDSVNNPKCDLKQKDVIQVVDSGNYPPVNVALFQDLKTYLMLIPGDSTVVHLKVKRGKDTLTVDCSLIVVPETPMEKE